MQTPAPPRRSPYQGLIPYAEEDAPFFFGRDRDTRLIVANLFASPLTLLYGMSGVGKSSVLRAGAVNRLRGDEGVFVLFFNTWQGDALNDLKAALTKAVFAQATFAPARGRSAFAVAGGLRRFTPFRAPLADYLAAWAARLGRRLMVILDQFEEYFLYHPQEDDFAEEFARAVVRPNAPVNFLVSVREDALAKLDRFEGRIPTLFDNYLRVEHLDRKAARAAIENPIRLYNTTLPSGEPPYSIEPALVEAVLEQVQTGQVVLGEAGRGVVKSEGDARVETPFLQMVMTRLWDEETRAGSRVLRLETLERLADADKRESGAVRIVRTHLDETMGSLPPDKQGIAAEVFHYLVTPSGTKIAHTVPDLAEYAEVPQQQLRPALEELAHGDVRILRPVTPPHDQPREPRYEIFHDVLAPAVLDWRSRYVQAEERAENERKLALEEQERRKAQQQLEREQRMVARQRRYLALLALLLIAMLAATAFAVQQRNFATAALTHAAQQRAEAEAQRSRADELRNRAEQASGEAEAARVEAVDATQKEAVQRKEAETQKTAALAAKADADRQRLAAQQSAAEALAERDAANTARAEVEAQKRISDSRALAASAIDELPFDPELSVLLATEALNIEDTEQARDALRRSLPESHLRATLRGHTDMVRAASFSPDGKRVVTASWDDTARVWDWATGSSTELKGHTNDVNSAVFSPDGRRVLTGSDDKTARLWDVTTGRSVELGGHKDWVINADFSPDGKRIVTVSDDGVARLWSPDGEKVVFLSVLDVEGDTSRPFRNEPSFAFSPDSKLVVTTHEGGRVHVWDAATGKHLKELLCDDAKPCQTSLVKEAVFSRDGSLVVTTSMDKTGVLWDAASWKKRATLKGHTQTILGAAFSSDGSWVATVSGDKTARLWRTKDGESVAVLQGHTSAVSRVAFSPDGNYVLTASTDGTARVWERETGRNLSVFRGRMGHLLDAEFSPDGRHVLTAAADGTARIWDALIEHNSGGLAHKRDLTGVEFSRNGRFIISAGGSLTVRDAASREIVNQVETGNCERPRLLDVSADGKSVLTDCAYSKVLLWDTSAKQTTTLSEMAFIEDAYLSPDGSRMATINARRVVRVLGRDGQPLAPPVTLQTPAGILDRPMLAFAVFSKDGKLVAGRGLVEPTIYVWDAATGGLVSSIQRHARDVSRAAFNSDGRFIITVSSDAAYVSETSTGRIVAELYPFMGEALDMDFSPSGKFIVTTHQDGRAVVWDAVSGRRITDLRGHSGAARGAAFSPDERFVATVGDDSMLRIQECEVCGSVEELMALAARRVSRLELTAEERARYLPPPRVGLPPKGSSPSRRARSSGRVARPRH